MNLNNLMFKNFVKICAIYGKKQIKYSFKQCKSVKSV